MKDRVFIVWSGSNKVAIQVKDILEKQYNYVCSIGGNSDNNSSFSSVGDTVIQQIKSCNQAIIIFQNRADGAVSNNLFFELGYVLAMYGQKKIHCVKRKNEDVVLPSDFDNSFVQSIEDTKEDLSDFANGIVDYFIGRQKMSVNENKMYLIDNRYLIHDKIVSHYSEKGSKCSDYELAQYLLFYMQAAHMFGDEANVYEELLDFKNKHKFEFSTELTIAVNMCLSFFEMVTNIKVDEKTSEVYIEKDVFWKVKKDYEHYKNAIVEDNLGVFDEWASLYVSEHMTFANMLIANNPAIDKAMSVKLYQKSGECAIETIENIERLEAQAPCKENNDSIGLISLFKAYVYRNLYLAKKVAGDREEAMEWLKKTMIERESLKNNFDKGAIDTKLYNNFCMEYYLSLVNYLSDCDEGEIDDFELFMYKSEIESYLDAVKKERSENAFLGQIEHWCKTNN